MSEQEQQQQRVRSDEVGGERQPEQAQSVEEVKAVLERQEPMPAGQQRLVLRVLPDHSVRPEPWAAELPGGAAPPHAPGTLVIQLVNVPGHENTLIIVRKGQLYEDVNAAINVLKGTADAGVDYPASLIPPALFDFGTREILGSKRVVVPVRCKSDCEAALSRNLPPEAVLEDQVIPVEVGEPRPRSGRAAALMHPLSTRRDRVPVELGQRRAVIQAAGKKAFRAVSAQYDAELKAHEQKHGTSAAGASAAPDPALVAEIEQVVGPLLDVPAGGDIPDDVIDSITQFVSNQLSQNAAYHRALLQWADATLRSGQRDPTSVWPIIQWLIRQSDEFIEEEATGRQLAETTEEDAVTQDELAFTVVPQRVELPWAQCDCCNKWRVTRRPLDEGEAAGAWYCHSTAGGGMDVRGMPPAVQELARGLQRIRERLRYPHLPSAERKQLERNERELCSRMCNVAPEANEDETYARLEQFASSVIETPAWTRFMQAYDAEVDRRERATRSLSHLLEADASGGEEEDSADMDEVTETKVDTGTEKLVKGIGTEADRAALEAGASEYIGGRVRDDIDFLKDVMEARAGELAHLREQMVALTEPRAELTELQASRDELQRELDSGTVTAERKADILQQLPSFAAKIDELEGKVDPTAAAGELTKLREEAQKLQAEQDEDVLRLEQLERTRERDPMIPGVADPGKQNAMFVIQAVAKQPRSVVHYEQDVRPAAEALRQAALGTGFGATAKDVVFAAMDPDKYQFLGARKSPLGSMTGKLGKGYFALRHAIRTPADVEQAVKDLHALVPTATASYLDAAREVLQRMYQENQVLPYVLGGAFGQLANQSLRAGPDAAVPREQQVALLRTGWGLDEPTTQALLAQWDRHLAAVQEQHKYTPVQALKLIARGAQSLETMRSSGQVARGTRAPWWTATQFPVVPPQSAPPAEVAAPVAMDVEPVPEPPAPMDVSSEPSAAQRAMQSILEPPAPTAQPRPPVAVVRVQPPVVQRKRKVKPTTTHEELELLKRVRVPPEPCGPQDVADLRAEAASLNLFIAEHDEGLTKLCQDMVGRDNAKLFLKTWRRVVDWAKKQLLDEGLDLSGVSDVSVQRLTLREKFTTPDQRQHILRLLRQSVPQAPPSQAAPPQIAPVARAPSAVALPQPFTRALPIIRVWASKNPHLADNDALLYELFKQSGQQLSKLRTLLETYKP